MAQTQLYGTRAQLHIKMEPDVSTGTFEPPDDDGTGIIMIEDGWTYTVESSNYEMQSVRPDWLIMDEIPGTVSVTITFRVPLKGSGTAGTAPEIDTVLRACGWDVTDTAAANTYAPVSTFDGAATVTPNADTNPGPSYSCSLLVDGERYSLKNGFGAFVISATTGEPAFMEVTMQGGYVAPAADALETGAFLPAYTTTVPPAFMGAAITIASKIPTGVDAFTLDSGNTLTNVVDANDANGISGARLVGRRVFGTISCEAINENTAGGAPADRDDFALWRANTTALITTGPIGSTAGNIWTLTVARATRRPVEVSVGDGILRHAIPFAAASVATDAEVTNEPVTLAFT